MFKSCLLSLSLLLTACDPVSPLTNEQTAILAELCREQGQLLVLKNTQTLSSAECEKP